MDHPELVQSVVGTINRLPKNSSQEQAFTTPDSPTRKDTPSPAEVKTHGLQIIRKALQSQGISPDDIDILMQSWRDSTKKQYRVYYQKWMLFCSGRKCDALSPTIGEVLDFLTDLHKSGLGYSAMNTARSALSSIIKIDNIPAGQHPLVKRFLRAVFNIKPALPRYSHSWDVSQVLKFLRDKPGGYGELKWTTYKLCMLLALLTGQRLQTLHLIDIRNVRIDDHKMTLSFGKTI